MKNTTKLADSLFIFVQFIYDFIQIWTEILY